MLLAALPAVGLSLMLGASIGTTGRASGADVKVTHKYLVPLCLDGARVEHGDRRWRLEFGEHAVALTMRNDPHTPREPHQKAVASGPPGVAIVRFTPEAGHRYQIEVRASAEAFSRRIWERGDWKPVVRDRTSDRIVSGEPEWTDSGCSP